MTVPLTISENRSGCSATLRQCYILALLKVFIDSFFFIAKTITVHRLHLDTIVTTSLKCLDKYYATLRAVALSIHKKKTTQKHTPSFTFC